MSSASVKISTRSPGIRDGGQQAGVAPARRGARLLDEDEEVLAARAHRGDPAVAVVQLKGRARAGRTRSIRRASTP